LLLSRYPKEVQLKDGSSVMLRPMTRLDEGPLLDFFTNLTEEDRLYLRNDVSNVRVVRSWFEQIDYQRVFPLLAVAGEDIVGDATLHRKPFSWMRHMGGIRIVIAPAYRNLGLARILADELLENALDEGLEKLTADVVIDQDVALEAFARLGFRKEATLKEYVLDSEGVRHDLVMMVKDIGD
jgi:RimJ/RimL family protein N-acetyltransferase